MSSRGQWGSFPGSDEAAPNAPEVREPSLSGNVSQDSEQSHKEGSCGTTVSSWLIAVKKATRSQTQHGTG
jgi:hypothetical protein